ncbi:hypothetical protein K432DRAFT_108266 [Lepidopterella palustris CBS 459.81]|uniref:DNA recombination and repair protein Rad51-like C-terminal domain-containing protein n=1 Tax=Lepidopterella palustris CBS 459.81 TaxID=1314670 RepID=A0A8E2E5N9_9PEZI|nr:hypothetical protein K432DRAFT_108266 [Lepidopterella palustris CBS 459.81]
MALQAHLRTGVVAGWYGDKSQRYMDPLESVRRVLAVNALNAGDQVVWVDTAAPMVARRLHEMLSAARPTKSLGVETSQPNLSLEEMQGHFHYYTTPTLAHLLAMFVHPPAVFPPPNTSLIVIDSLSTLFDNAYPRNADDGASKSKNDTTRWAAGRKFSVMNELVSKLGRIAAMHNIAVLITCQTITRIRAGWGALLLPAMSGVEWDNGISTRLVLFRDWLPGKGKWNDCDLDRLRRARFVGVVKANGVMLAADEGGVGTVVPFTIEASGLCDLNFAAVDIAPPPLTSPARPPKRTFAEIADSEDEEPDLDEHYGWVEDDEVAAEGLIIDEASLIYDLNTTSPQKEAAPDTLLSRREGPTG